MKTTEQLDKADEVARLKRKITYLRSLLEDTLEAVEYYHEHEGAPYLLQRVKRQINPG